MLLNNILSAMGLSREDVYLCDVVKCQPPENRIPDAGEVSACEPFLARQIAVIKPLVIVTLGKFASQTLLTTTQPIVRFTRACNELLGFASGADFPSCLPSS